MGQPPKKTPFRFFSPDPSFPSRSPAPRAMDAVDDEKKAAFVELQTSLMQTTTQIRTLQQNMAQRDGDVRRAKLVQTELSSMPDDTRTYLALGKAFVMEGKKDVEDLMARTISEKQVELEGLEKSRTYVLKKREECEGQIRELLSSTPDLARAIAAASR